MRRFNLNLVSAFCAAQRNVSFRFLTNVKQYPVVAPKPANYATRRFYCQSNSKCWNCQSALSPDLSVQYTCLTCKCLLNVPVGCVSSWGDHDGSRCDRIFWNNQLYLILLLRGQNYFQLLGLEAKYNVNSIELQRRFRAVQGILHPDKFSNKYTKSAPIIWYMFQCLYCRLCWRSEKEQELSAEWSSLVNNAFRTLLSPIRRGEYLLELQGVTIPESNSEMNKEFLMEMMERNEEVRGRRCLFVYSWEIFISMFSICFQVADVDDAKELQELLNKVRVDMVRCAADLGKSFDAKNLDEARTILITFRYFVSLENSIKEKSNRLGFHL